MTRHRKSPRRADARLLELVARFRRLRKQMDVLWRREELCADADWEQVRNTIRAETFEFVDRCWAIRTAVANLPARTPEGLKAKAWLALWETCDGAPEEGPPDHPDVAIAWSLARDIAEKRP
ncbi:hypothetical protein [Acidisoma silvae]|uniref:Uncharacterized protein n=1 Tax=Acidisoma silvae TaxID=2802396 RepID=A0A964E0S1_9PROT|nr:hypothetical protein [Acidisoma silvae]MCB8877606.1 hypothetical protein [Acidisoma silvae]